MTDAPKIPIKNKSQQINIPIHIFNWGPCIVRFKISDQFREALLKEAYKARAEKRDYRKKLAGHIKEEYAMDLKEFNPYFKQVFNLYHGAWKNFTGDTGKEKVEYVMKTLWVNFQKQNEYNPLHDHSEALTFVIYLKIPQEIKTENEAYVGTSRGPGSIMFVYGEGGRQFVTYQSHLPEDRDIFVFPAAVKHMVAPFRSDCERISVSGNVSSHIPIAEMPPHIKYEVVDMDDPKAANLDPNKNVANSGNKTVEADKKP